MDMSTQMPFAVERGSPLYAGAVTESATPPVAFATSVSTDTLLLLCMMLAIIALGAIFGTIRMRRATRRSAREAQAQGAAMRELLRSLRMAETIAGVGVWQFDYETQQQQWSDGLKRIFGVDHDAEMHEGDAETLLFTNNVDLVSRVRQSKGLLEPYSMPFDIVGFDGIKRTIEVQACNLRNAEGRVQRVVAIVRDVTEDMAAESTAHDPSEGGADNSQKIARIGIVRDDDPDEIDPVTGLANRRQTMRELDRLVMQSRAARRPLVLVLFDIDHFDRIASSHGDPERNRLLEQVGRIARGQARECDFVGRVGEESFALILPAVSDASARVITERLRQTVARDSGSNELPSVTISGGSATVQAADSALSLFARADQALYEAKYSGRNRVRVAA